MDARRIFWFSGLLKNSTQLKTVVIPLLTFIPYILYKLVRNLENINGVLKDGSGFARIRVFTPSYFSVSMPLHLYPLNYKPTNT